MEQFIHLGLKECICTDISRDGMLEGPSFGLYRELCEAYPGIGFTASGGISSMADIEKLNEMGVPAEDLDDFCRSVRDHIDKGVYFTVKSLLGSGFDSSLVHAGFGEYFLSSVLAGGKEGFPYQRMGGVRLFCSGDERPSLSAFLRSLVREHGSIRAADLETLLKDEYGIELSPYKMTELIKESDVGYDPITRTAFDTAR